ncbi:MAG: phenylalanine--tRNA ligase subunit beta [Propioniciclava sp.]
MKATKSWIAEYAALPDGLSGRDLGEALVTAGLEVEAVSTIGGDITGPLVIGRVVDFIDMAQKNGKIIRWCHVDCGADHAPETPPEPLREGDAPASGLRGIICGALNFVPGDHVIVALPGSVLPGGFAIGSRKTYGQLSDGMICSERELGLGEDHDGIVVLGETDDAGTPWTPGASALSAIGAGDEVLDMPITSDMGYCLSVRGLAREAAQALDVGYTDVIATVTPPATDAGYPVLLESDRCPLFVALTVEGFDPAAASPRWLRQRLAACGMRSISLSVDVSNYVMLETGQPNHCYDADSLRGPIVVRQARAGERLRTLDDVDRSLEPEDLVIADDRGVIGLAGVMGGEDTELRDTTTRIVIEAANFTPVSVARTSRRHKLSSEASRRFERSVDPGAAYGAAQRVAQLLTDLGGGQVVAETVAGVVPAMRTQTLDAGLPERVLGMPVSPERVVEILQTSGVTVEEAGGRLTLTPPSWRADLIDAYDYVEEVGIKVGYEQLPSVVPAAPVGRGLTRGQSLRRALTRSLAATGLVEVLTFPWASEADFDGLGLPPDDHRRQAVRLANPLADTAPLLRTTILPGLFGALQRNVSRGFDDVTLFELGRVFTRSTDAATPLPGVEQRPTQAELNAIEATLPSQPRHLAAVVAGNWHSAGWNRGATPAGWEQAFALIDVIAGTVGVSVQRRGASRPPWHPGRCAEVVAAGRSIGFVGELHPSVIRAFSLPARTAALEIDLDHLVQLSGDAGSIQTLSAHPVAKEDVALVVDESVPAGELQQALAQGAGALLESLWVFDVYRGAPIPPGLKSVAFALRFRAADHTLTDAEVAEARSAAVAEAAVRHGAVLRS